MEAAPFNEVSKKSHLRTSAYITWSDLISKDDKECYLLAEHTCCPDCSIIMGEKRREWILSNPVAQSKCRNHLDGLLKYRPLYPRSF